MLFIWDYGSGDGVYAQNIFCQNSLFQIKYGVSDVLILGCGVPTPSSEISVNDKFEEV